MRDPKAKPPKLGHKIVRQIYAARFRKNRKWRGKPLPSSRLIRNMIADRIIWEIIDEEKSK